MSAAKKTIKEAVKKPETKKQIVMDEEEMASFEKFLGEFPGKFCIPVMTYVRKYIKEVPIEN